MGDEEDLRERQEAYKNDRKDQAKWYESLNLYAEALRIYRSIEDQGNIRRLEDKMKAEYGKEAVKLEGQGSFQQAANLYYLIGDHASVGRLKKMKPELVIIYDEEGGGIADVASGIGMDDERVDDDPGLFTKQNEEFEIDTDDVQMKDEVDRTPEEKQAPIIGRKGVPIKMPKNHKKMRFCPYCGERISTRKEPKFCPFCGDELV